MPRSATLHLAHRLRDDSESEFSCGLLGHVAPDRPQAERETKHNVRKITACLLVCMLLVGGLHPSLVVLKDRSVTHTTTTCVTIGY